MTVAKPYPAEVLIYITKDGWRALFVEEITKSLLAYAGQLKAWHGHYELVGELSYARDPCNVQDSLMR